MDSPQSDPKQSYVQVTFQPDPGLDLKFDGLSGSEQLGRPFLYHLKMASGKWKGDVENLIGATASLKFVGDSNQIDPDDTTDYYVNGIVTRVVSEGLENSAYRYTMEVRPWIWLLSREEDCRIWNKKSAFDIITDVFRKAGFTDFEDNRKASAGSDVLAYCVQYRETSFDFVTRLMEEYGIYYYFKHDQSTHTLVLSDDPNSHTELSDAVPFQFDRTEFRGTDDHIWEWTSDYSLQAGKYTVRDYDFKAPSVDLTSKSNNPGTYTHASIEVYEYPGPYWDKGLGQKIADVRMQSIASHRKRYQGSSNSRKLHAGWKFTLSKHKDDSLNRAYLICQADIQVGLAEGMSTTDEEGEKIDTYRVTLRAIPSDVNFRLDRTTRRPMIRGPQTAKVVGPSGDEIYTDEFGRIKVRFHWDRDEETQDEDRTCWIRVAQGWGGAGWGSIILPRVGMEVVVEFLEGNPDRPLVTGVVYNANQTVPYSLPDNKTRSTFKTSSSTGGSGFNELRFEDKAGSEEVFFQAQKDYTKKVLNNETVTITQNTTTTVEQGNRGVTVSQGNDSLTVSTGNHTISVSAGESGITAAQSITLTCGGSSIKLTPSGVQISAAQVTVSATASMSADGGASMSLTAGTISIN